MLCLAALSMLILYCEALFAKNRFILRLLFFIFFVIYYFEILTITYIRLMNDSRHKRDRVQWYVCLKSTPHHLPFEKVLLWHFASRSILWNVVEKKERRCDSQTAREVQVALPIEFSLDESIQIVREYIDNDFVSHGMCADFSIHDTNSNNPHAHIILTMRDVTPEGFGKKIEAGTIKHTLKIGARIGRIYVMSN